MNFGINKIDNDMHRKLLEKNPSKVNKKDNVKIYKDGEKEKKKENPSKKKEFKKAKKYNKDKVIDRETKGNFIDVKK